MELFLREPGRVGVPALGVWATFGNPLAAEVLALAGPDYVCIDMQHGDAHEGNLVALVQAVCSGGSVPIVRVPENNPAAIMKALDVGARGVIVPLVESGEEAARAVAACRYPPTGSRSYGPFRAALHARTIEPRELEKVACIVMIETRAGIDNLAEIVHTDGVTAVYVGPSDLSLGLGLPPASLDAPEFVEVLGQIRAECERAGIVAGIHCYEGTTARHFIDEGFQMVTVAADMRSLGRAVAHELAAARGAKRGAGD
jgi:4-hydroxy-2-oxoheptanedioate aldolase